MKYYQTTTEFNCGIDLHTRQMYICVMNRAGEVLVHRNIRNNDFEFFLKLVEPYRKDLTVTCESCFVCFWLADACEDAGIEFVLAHAYYVKSIAANKHKNDKEDARELAECLRTNRIPPAYVCPRDLRPIRKLLRRRNKYVKNRAVLTGHSTCEVMAAGNQPLGISSNSKERWREGIRDSFDDPLDSFTADAELYMIESYERDDAMQRASVKDFHSLRTTWITMALSAGVPMELVRRVTGHSTVDVVLKHYFRPGKEAFKTALESAMPKMLTGGGQEEKKAPQDALLWLVEHKDELQKEEFVAKVAKIAEGMAA
jgi:hypothetical protein